MKEMSSNSQVRPSVRHPDLARQKRMTKSRATAPRTSGRASYRGLRVHRPSRRWHRETVETMVSIRPRLGQMHNLLPRIWAVGAFGLPTGRREECLCQPSYRSGLSQVDREQTREKYLQLC